VTSRMDDAKKQPWTRIIFAESREDKIVVTRNCRDDEMKAKKKKKIEKRKKKNPLANEPSGVPINNNSVFFLVIFVYRTARQ